MLKIYLNIQRPRGGWRPWNLRYSTEEHLSALSWLNGNGGFTVKRRFFGIRLLPPNMDPLPLTLNQMPKPYTHPQALENPLVNWNTVYAHITIKVGNEISTSVWKYMWLGNSSLQHLFRRLYHLHTRKMPPLLNSSVQILNLGCSIWEETFWRLSWYLGHFFHFFYSLDG